MGAKPFQFKLQSILEYRTMQADLAQQALAKEESIRTQHLQAIAQAQAEVAQAVTDFAGMLDPQQHQATATQHTQWLTDGALFSNFLNQKKQQVLRAQQALKAHEPAWQAAKQVLVAARVAQKQFEKLKEKQSKSHQHQANAAHLAYLDELSTGRYIRQHQSQETACV